MLKKFYSRFAFVILFAYLIAAWFFPPLGILAIICMLSPILFALAGKGRYWCGHFCPRGNFYNNLIKPLSARRPIPGFLKTTWFRILMILFILGNFSYGIYHSWGNPGAMGMVFYRIIVVTTVVGIVLGLIFMERTWCSFCPMGSLAFFISKAKKKQ